MNSEEIITQIQNKTTYQLLSKIDKELQDNLNKINSTGSLLPIAKEIIIYILSELGDNIEQHSHSSKIQLFSEIENSAKQIIIFVSDNGIGIPKLFHKHFKENNNNWEEIKKALSGISTKGDGRGYGLRTIKKIVEYCEGKMIIVSNGFGYTIDSKSAEKIKISDTNGTKVAIILPNKLKITPKEFYKILEG
ncbi:MAG: hypothetical protein CEN91_521 [Candidatus Berkelbacteria bacterium Licking1014_85]|uniref:histidine kinase n=1 Tax=Candidatus Berkelbacteria bacterium Licking1014_85 TaxID=2017148 RepID=A0A554LH80_9BACT|nr:MAG: hypothetical protein CEN91_521 [Candidatus Berkelbacteria bacterium Licking1014_85]